MSKTINNGGPAFPLAHLTDTKDGPAVLVHRGMTLRDYFAAKAMQGMCSSDAHCVDGWAHSDIAAQAYQIADAMLRAREAA